MVLTHSTSELSGFLAETRAAVDRVIDRWCRRLLVEEDSRVTRAMVYALTSPGKRLRPALAVASHRAVGGSGAAFELAAAVEVIHCYSLVHDDLPCMDDDDLRRGRPTAHRAFDVATATEAGYRMIALAGRVLAEGARALKLDSGRLKEMALELFRAAGGRGMIGGQVLDLEAEGREVGLEEILAIDRAKTGALIAASAVIGAIAGGAGQRKLSAIRAYGEALGLAFQIADDLLDITGTAAELGKAAGKDRDRKKATFATAMSVEEARARARHYAEEAVAHLRRADVDCTLLAPLAQFVVERRS
ncbi:Farnesyl diphosphate synthase [bacterium HR33]|nr:Farnesyl diphosphate synthase [bacterium HR33]